MNSFIYTHKAQYYETDQMGIIHHSNYIRWFEEARIDFLQEIGYPYEKLEEMGILCPVLEVQASYRSMVHFGDTVSIETWVERFNGMRLVMKYEVKDEKTGELRTTGSSSHCFLDKDKKLIALKHTYPKLHQLLTECVKK